MVWQPDIEWRCSLKAFILLAPGSYWKLKLTSTDIHNWNCANDTGNFLTVAAAIVLIVVTLLLVPILGAAVDLDIPRCDCHCDCCPQ